MPVTLRPSSLHDTLTGGLRERAMILSHGRTDGECAAGVRRVCGGWFSVTEGAGGGGARGAEAPGAEATPTDEPHEEVKRVAVHLATALAKSVMAENAKLSSAALR
jgi:hypothetical protein